MSNQDDLNTSKFNSHHDNTNTFNNLLSSENNGDNMPKIQKRILPKKIKLEIMTDFERNMSGLAILGVTITSGLFFYFYKQNIFVHPFSAISAAITIVIIITRYNLDEYYVLDSNKQALMIIKKLFSNETCTMFAHFKTIEATVGNGQFNAGGKNSPGYWEYRAEIILRTGKIIPIEDWHRDGLKDANRKAKKFAEVANASFVQGKKEISATATKINGKYTFVVKKAAPHKIPLSTLFTTLILMAIGTGLTYYAVNYL